MHLQSWVTAFGTTTHHQPYRCKCMLISPLPILSPSVIRNVDHLSCHYPGLASGQPPFSKLQKIKFRLHFSPICQGTQTKLMHCWMNYEYSHAMSEQYSCTVTQPYWKLCNGKKPGGGVGQGPATKMNHLGLYQLPFSPVYMYMMCQIIGVFILITSMVSCEAK